MWTVTPEHRVLLGCCRLETGDAVAAEIRVLLDVGLDWDRLIEWAVWHQISPLLHRTLARVAPDQVPPAVAFALRAILGYDLFDAPLPQSVLAHRNRRMESLIADVSQRLFHEKSEPPTLWKPNRFRFSIRERFRDKTRYVLRTMLAPQPSLFESIHLPENLFWAYYPTRWVHDYLLLPPWLVWKRLRSG